MIKHAWSLLAQNTVVDQTSNTLSIQVVVENLNVSIPATNIPNEVVVPFNGQLIALLYRDDVSKIESAIFHFIFLSPSGETLLQGSQQAEFPKGKRNIRIIGGLNGLKLRGEGIYRFEISLDNEHVQTLPLEVHLTPTVEA